MPWWSVKASLKFYQFKHSFWSNTAIHTFLSSVQSSSLPVNVSKGHLMPTFLNDFQFCKWANILKNLSNSMDRIFTPEKCYNIFFNILIYIP